PPPLAAQGLASDAHAAHSQRGFARSTQQPQVQRRQQRQRQHQQQVLGPKEVHLGGQSHHNSAIPRARNRGFCQSTIEHGFWLKRSATSRTSPDRQAQQRAATGQKRSRLSLTLSGHSRSEIPPNWATSGTFKAGLVPVQ